MASSEPIVDRYQRGLEKRNEIAGPGTSSGGTGTKALAPYFARWVVENVFGDLWSRPALGNKTRSLITVVALATTHQYPQLKGHLRNAIRQGWTPEELAEVLVHLAGYVGVPTTHNALDVLCEALKEGDETSAEGDSTPAP